MQVLRTIISLVLVVFCAFPLAALALDVEVKVAENVEVDEDFEYGVGLDVCLNVEMIDDEVVENFIADFLAGKLNLDKTLYSFTSEDEEEE